MTFNWMLIRPPIELVAAEQHLLVSLAAALTIVPRPGWFGEPTVQLAERSGDGLGALLNADIGNASELMMALSTMRAGLHDVVKVSVIGSIVGTTVLPPGTAMLGAGRHHQKQQYNASATRSRATLLPLGSSAVAVPATCNAAVSPALQTLNLYFPLVLLVYGVFLVYPLVPHKSFHSGAPNARCTAHEAPLWAKGKALLLLAMETGTVAWISELLLPAFGPSARQLGLSSLFIGLLIVAIFGNAAETSCDATRKRMNLSLAVVIGSSVRVAVRCADASAGQLYDRLDANGPGVLRRLSAQCAIGSADQLTGGG